nr:DUF2178 domain-containing protein [uncultured Methanospirillum sp.]
MKYIHYVVWIIGIAILAGIMVGWSIISGLIWIPLIIIPLAVIVGYSGRKIVSPILDDELNQRIHGDAAMRTLEVLFVTGIIITSILFSLSVSSAYIPKINGHIVTNDDNTRSMSVTIQYLNPLDISNPTLRSYLIRNIEDMTYQDAGSYATFWQEGLRPYYEYDLMARIGGSLLIFLLLVYGSFYLYYRRKY